MKLLPSAGDRLDSKFLFSASIIASLWRLLAASLRHELQAGSEYFLWVSSRLGVSMNGVDFFAILRVATAGAGVSKSSWKSDFVNFWNFGDIMRWGNRTFSDERRLLLQAGFFANIDRCDAKGGLKINSVSNWASSPSGEPEKLPSDPSSDSQSIFSPFSSGMEGISHNSACGRG